MKSKEKETAKELNINHYDINVIIESMMILPSGEYMSMDIFEQVLKENKDMKRMYDVLIEIRDQRQRELIEWEYQNIEDEDDDEDEDLSKMEVPF